MLGGQLTHSLLQSLCGGELRSHLYFQDAVCHHWSLCPHVTSSLTLRLCRIPFHSIVHQSKALSWVHAGFPHSIHCECDCGRDFELLFWLQRVFQALNESTSRSNKRARRPGGIAPGHLTGWFRRGATISESQIHHNVLTFQSLKSKQGEQESENNISKMTRLAHWGVGAYQNLSRAIISKILLICCHKMLLSTNVRAPHQWFVFLDKYKTMAQL